MKRYLVIGIVLIVTVLGNACKKDNTSPTTSPTTEPFVGTWRVSSFIKDSVELASQFTGYTFTCNSNGVMTIAGHSNSYNCSWSYNDNNHSMCHFHIMGCDDNSILWECDDDWDLISHDANNCHFTNHNPQHHSSMTWTKV